MHTKGNGSPRPNAQAQARHAFQGRLENVTLFEIFSSLASTGTKGMLFLEGPPPGLIVFDQGEVRTARRGDLDGVPALAQLLLLTRGRFQFIASREVGDLPQAASVSPVEANETFGARALRALDGARTRLFSPRPDGLLEIPRAREAIAQPADSPAY